MAEEEKKEEKKAIKERKPTALKRIQQSDKRNLNNREMRSKVKTAIKDLSSAIEKKEDKDQVAKKLNMVFSLSDKAVKMNVFKKNKADRVKSRSAMKMTKASIK